MALSVAGAPTLKCRFPVGLRADWAVDRLEHFVRSRTQQGGGTVIQTGMTWLGYSETPGWHLNAGSGDRTFTSTDIPSNPPFATPPTVALMLGGVDSEHDTNLRIILTPFDVDEREFNVRIQTWGDTLIYQVWVTWIAFD